MESQMEAIHPSVIHNPVSSMDPYPRNDPPYRPGNNLDEGFQVKMIRVKKNHRKKVTY